MSEETASATFTAVEFWLVKGKYKAKAVRLAHKERVTGRNIVAVIDGRMHRIGDCKWCQDLGNRCASRRSA